jgi:acetoin utilization deacetylase AcuC-like enzyme
MWHDPGHGGGILPAGGWVEPGLHAENPEPKRRFHNLVHASGFDQQLVAVRPRPATEEELLRFHTASYLERLERASAGRGGDASKGGAGDETPFGTGGYEIAQLAAGGALAAVEAVLDGRGTNAYALIRPPGHHAAADEGRGFCLLANVVLAVLHARARFGVRRVAIVDWDVHHGNGTQEAFYADGDALTISVHQDGAYPELIGRATERGTGAATQANVNVPLPAGSGAGAYRHAFERIVVPQIDRFEPELIVIACGFDASAADPSGRMMLHSAAFADMTNQMLALADVHCDGRLVAVHEGGYSPHYVPFCGLAVLEALAGRGSGVEDPYLAGYASRPGQDLQPHQRTAIADVEAILRA